jgi:hypothetical protein
VLPPGVCRNRAAANIAISLGMCPPGSDTTGRTAHLRNSREARAPGGWAHRRNRADSKNPWRAFPGHRTNRAAHLNSSQSSDASPGYLGGASQSDRWNPKTLPLLPPKDSAGDTQEHQDDSSDHHFWCFQSPLALVCIYKRCLTSFKARKTML